MGKAGQGQAASGFPSLAARCPFFDVAHVGGGCASAVCVYVFACVRACVRACMWVVCGCV